MFVFITPRCVVCCFCFAYYVLENVPCSQVSIAKDIFISMRLSDKIKIILNTFTKKYIVKVLLKRIYFQYIYI